jgi:hypothetical protein
MLLLIPPDPSPIAIMIFIAFRTTFALLAPILLSTSASGRPAGRPKDGTIPAGTTTTFNGQTFVNKGLVGFGAVPPSTLDSTGLTLGGLGSAAQFVPGSWRRKGKSNLYSGTLITQPDVRPRPCQSHASHADLG